MDGEAMGVYSLVLAFMYVGFIGESVAEEKTGEVKKRRRAGRPLCQLGF